MKRKVSSATEMEIGKTLTKYLAESTPRKEEGEAKLNTSRTSQSEVESDLTDTLNHQTRHLCVNETRMFNDSQTVLRVYVCWDVLDSWPIKMSSSHFSVLRLDYKGLSPRHV